MFFSERVSHSLPKVRKPNKFRNFIARLILVPDYGIVWGILTFINKEVRKAVEEAEFVISSSPPESSHFIAYKLAKKYNKFLVTDMRDGWLDDPLKVILQENCFRKFIELKLEGKILNYSSKIFVSSPVWYKLLLDRYKDFSNKLSVLTNAYPRNYEELSFVSRKSTDKLILLYLGKLTASRESQKINFILEPLLRIFKFIRLDYEIHFVGRFIEEDYLDLSKVVKKYPECTNKIKFFDEIPRLQIFEEMNKANGLLLLCISKSSNTRKVL